jgi:serine/threonine protein kinase
MGRVYRAKHMTIEREYAIKVLYGDLAVEEEFRARFQREAASVSRIRHPNVVSVSDFGITESGLSFIVMELIPGRTLLRTIEMDGPLVPPRAGRIARQIAEALGAAHAAGFVHRDVKSTNVMLLGLEDQVKVLDFGTVSLGGTQNFDERLTTIGQLIGTPAYMAPEQFEDPSVGPPADLYSMGVVLYHMLAGRLPFSSSHPTELMVQHMTQAPPPLPECGGLERLAMRLLEKEPAQRPRSADEVIRAIDNLILDGSSDGFQTETEQVPVQSAPPPRSKVLVFDRPPIAEADTPREEDVPTVRPEEDDEHEETHDTSGDLEAPPAPTPHDPAESSTTRDTSPDDLQAPDLPAGSVVRIDSAETKMLAEESLPSSNPVPPPGTDWGKIVLVGGIVVFLAVLILSLLR